MRRDIGRLFDAISWSPSLTKGVISASFHAAGNVEVRREQLIISVSGPRIIGRQSLMTRAFILSGPGDLFSGKDETNWCTSSLVTVRNEKRSSEGI